MHGCQHNPVEPLHRDCPQNSQESPNPAQAPHFCGSLYHLFLDCLQLCHCAVRSVKSFSWFLCRNVFSSLYCQIALFIIYGVEISLCKWVRFCDTTVRNVHEQWYHCVHFQECKYMRCRASSCTWELSVRGPEHIMFRCLLQILHQGLRTSTYISEYVHWQEERLWCSDLLYTAINNM